MTVSFPLRTFRFRNIVSLAEPVYFHLICLHVRTVVGEDAHLQEKDVRPVQKSKSPLQLDSSPLHSMPRQGPLLRLCRCRDAAHGPLLHHGHH
jgi:hypothetical protein